MVVSAIGHDAHHHNGNDSSGHVPEPTVFLGSDQEALEGSPPLCSAPWRWLAGEKDMLPSRLVLGRTPFWVGRVAPQSRSRRRHRGLLPLREGVVEFRRAGPCQCVHPRVGVDCGSSWAVPMGSTDSDGGGSARSPSPPSPTHLFPRLSLDSPVE